MNQLTRRRLLATSLGGLGASLAGCVDGVLDSSGDGDAGTGTVPDGARWFPAPSAFDEPAYAAFTIRIGAFHQRRDSFSSGFFDELPDPSELPGFDELSQIEAIHSVGTQASVLEGSVDRDGAIGFYTDGGFEQVGSRAGYTILEGSIGSLSPERVAAVGDEAVLTVTPWSNDDEDEQPLRPIAEAVVDAETDAAERYHEANAGFRAVLEELPDGDTVGGGAMPPGRSSGGVVAAGASSTVGSSTTEIEGVTIYEDSSAVVDPATTNATTSSLFQGADVTRSTDGRIVRRTASVPNENLESPPVGLPI